MLILLIMSLIICLSYDARPVIGQFKAVFVAKMFRDLFLTFIAC